MNSRFASKQNPSSEFSSGNLIKGAFDSQTSVNMNDYMSNMNEDIVLSPHLENKAKKMNKISEMNHALKMKKKKFGEEIPRF
jgi:hypothetical protein